MTTVTACPMCGTEPLPKARFCHDCGAAVARADSRAEYKQVTMLFADVVRSMDIAASVGAERLREIMAELIGRGAAVVNRYGGTMEKFTGDGLMALFGAPAALEDHAFRACLAALAIQEEATKLAVDVARRDAVTLRLRVGLNSGQVVAGEIGSSGAGYAAIGEQVGLAQRMEAAAPPGGVMLSESTARLVEHAAVLADLEMVSIKGRDTPVPARRLVAIRPRDPLAGRVEANLVGRRWEMAVLGAMMDRAIGGGGGVVNVVGPPGIGKSRTAREAAVAASGRGAEVFWTFCESHARDVPFHAVTRLLRAGTGVAELDDHAARARVREQVPDADPHDLLLLDDLLGIADPEVPLPAIDPDARRRRLTALINTASLARTEPALYLIEDAQWIDPVSESMLADLLTVIAKIKLMVLITSRPEYQGALMRVRGAQTIALAPLADSDTATLIGELLGSDPSVAKLAVIIAERAAGNPFFAEEMVRELDQRGVLTGGHGHYVCHASAAEITVPASVQAAIEARIDRLSAAAKRTVNAASVIGARFGAELLTAVGIDAVVDEPVGAELIDQVAFSPNAEYAFRHPLIRAVAYESQLKTDRAELHRRVAAAIESRHPTAADENSALIAEHLEAAGDLPAAYQWHVRAATWATNRDIAAAQQGWERARAIADAMPADDPNRPAMRIAPRTMLCGIAWRIQTNLVDNGFDELRELCTAAGDNLSLVIGMAGLVMDHAFRGRIREASRLASDAWSLIESIGDATTTVGLSFPLIYPKSHSGEYPEALRWSQRAIDLADGDPTKGNFVIGSPLAVAFTTRAYARYCLGRSGWGDDLRQGLAIANSTDAFTSAAVVAYVYFPGIPLGVLAANDRALRDIEDSLHIAQHAGDDMALAFAQAILGLALLHRPTDAERSSGQQLLADVSAVLRQRQHNVSELRLIEVYLARERARTGQYDEAISSMFATLDRMTAEGQLLSWGIPATGLLVETLLDRGGAGDVADAEAAIARLACAQADEGPAIRDIWLLRLRALLARARDDAAAYAHWRDRYRATAQSLGFQGHTAWADAMI